ncbi:mannose-6-phosphate isomerase, class I [Amycolatopsis jiangsuensis]|uniref:mannose-6-phosphate isomerase n=1 Tax=Amycolatopsis jiangsuensis TaxID=1181879 RepID=A0A840J5Q8_9PSEU|nr:mannose-6-phosphate isomerase, class I [Amycolatopsis jiangsuensis]MBB4688757.1 mannose-6-phosphate isomerase [Amycolatopsis jiangsuensis]
MDRLVNTVRRYDWGSVTAIPALRGLPPDGRPQAELWIGAHASASSRIDRGDGPVSLSAAIEADPVAELGTHVVRGFGPRLPFLLKVLAADRPLSLQVHPNLEQAAAGFADEERRGIPIDASQRTYRDTNHKPELLCALTPFTGLCGFRAPAAAADLLAELDIEAARRHVELLRTEPDALATVLIAFLTQERARTAELVELVAQTFSAGPHRIYADLARRFPGDPGVLAALLLNPVRLRPGEALYLEPGVPHAYVSGLGVEVMANSDNVLRCGLTGKHIDVPGLLNVVRFEPKEPRLVRPIEVDDEEVYPSPAKDFRLSRRVLNGETRTIRGAGPRILLCTHGRVVVRLHTETVALTSGESVFVPAREHGEAVVHGTGTLFSATVGE